MIKVNLESETCERIENTFSLIEARNFAVKNLKKKKPVVFQEKGNRFEENRHILKKLDDNSLIPEDMEFLSLLFLSTDKFRKEIFPLAKESSKYLENMKPLNQFNEEHFFEKESMEEVLKTDFIPVPSVAEFSYFKYPWGYEAYTELYPYFDPTSKDYADQLSIDYGIEEKFYINNINTLGVFLELYMNQVEEHSFSFNMFYGRGIISSIVNDKIFTEVLILEDSQNWGPNSLSLKNFKTYLETFVCRYRNSDENMVFQYIDDLSRLMMEIDPICVEAAVQLPTQVNLNFAKTKFLKKRKFNKDVIAEISYDELSKITDDKDTLKEFIEIAVYKEPKFYKSLDSLEVLFGKEFIHPLSFRLVKADGDKPLKEVFQLHEELSRNNQKFSRFRFYQNNEDIEKRFVKISQKILEEFCT